tara:strand:- start:3385 stop:3717 length:333 start_codon:yes stop_codon:yes gene_type:complete
MGDIVGIYESLGIYGSVACMFLFLVYSMNKRASDQASSIENLKIENEGQSKQIAEILKETEESKAIVVRLIDRWNKSDETRDRRHEKLLESLDDLSNSVAYLQGKSNGHK